MQYYRMNPRYKKTSSGGIYGAEWDGSSTTVWTRTDDAVGLANPNPYYAGMSDTPSSPFDDISPWKDMVISEDASAGTVVAIPKFYYKLSRPESSPTAGLKIQISMSQFDGSHVSPAHMDRGDGAGERDVVYVGRYHCDTSTIKSVTGVRPYVNATRSTMRTAIHNLGSNIWQMDFATRFTIWLLYLVEFADWDSQSKIGYGCGNGSSAQNMGYTDSMPYHTGTTKSSKTTYGLGTQYRNIEGLWDNVYDWLDGAYYNSNGLNIILNPANFSDGSGGIAVGVPSSGYPSAFDVKMVNDTYPVFIPTKANGTSTACSCDGWSFSSTGLCLYGGGDYEQYLYFGLFCVVGYNATSTSISFGCRLMILP